jgi:hypothetical protein
MKLFVEGEKDQHRLTVYGLSYLRKPRSGNRLQKLSKFKLRCIQPLRASRCFRRELRRVNLAFAARTASVRVGCRFGCAAFVALRAGIIGVGIIEPLSMGCILMGPVNFDLALGITNNSIGPNLFDGVPLSGA